MLKHKFLLLILIFFSGCGYTPLYLGANDLDIKVNLSENTGDREITNSLRILLKKNMNSKSDDLVTISINSEYDKIIASKDAAGLPSNYDLKAKSVITIKYNDNTQVIKVDQKFTMSKLESKFDENNYELTIKRNFANIVYQKLVVKLNQIKLND